MIALKICFMVLFVFGLPRYVHSHPLPNCPSRRSDEGDGYIYTLPAVQDVWLENRNNLNFNRNFLIVGTIPQYPKKRTLIQFEDFPQHCCRFVKWAKMYLYFWYAHKAGWHSVHRSPYISRTLQVHQMKKSWDETQATATSRKTGLRWNEPYVALDGRDAEISPVDRVTMVSTRPSGYVEFDITEAARAWNDAGESNYGFLIWATNENILGRSLRFYSKERSSNRPFVRIQC